MRICEAFPPLIDDTVSLLIQLGKMAISEATLKIGVIHLNVAEFDDGYLSDHNNSSNMLLANDHLSKKIEETFVTIISRAVLKNKIY